MNNVEVGKVNISSHIEADRLFLVKTTCYFPQKHRAESNVWTSVSLVKCHVQLCTARPFSDTLG